MSVFKRKPPHLPFLSGPPEFVVGLRPIAPEAWLWPDYEAEALLEKRALMASHPHLVCAALPESAAAQNELAKLAGAADFIALAQSVSDDFCIMAARGEAFVLVAAVLCAPGQWVLADMMGKPPPMIHAGVPDQTGPDGAQALGSRINRVFAGLQPGLVLERFNWTIQPGPDRFTPHSAPLHARAAAAPEESAAALLHLRVERQTIRKLPQTGAVVFSIRVSLDPLSAVFSAPGARTAFVQAYERAPSHVRAYKGWANYDRLVHAALAQS